jgi:cytosine/uracil/thiamine/allantoin permease
MLALGLSWRQALPAISVGHIIIAVVMVRRPPRVRAPGM